jgi:MFS family permease
MPRPLAALRSGPLRRYLVGQLPSVTCSWAQVVALSWVVVDRDPHALGWVMAAQFLPSLVLGPWFGAVADRHDRQRLLMLAEAGLGLVAVSYALVSATGRLTLPSIYVLATVWGVVNALDTPARRALVPMLVPAENGPSASALSGTVLLVGMTAGSALGAALVATAGVTVTFAVNAVSFLADVVVLGTVRVGASPRVERAPGQVRDGLTYVWHTPALRAALLTLAVVALLAFSVQVSVPILVRTAFGGGPRLVGAGLTAVTGGSLAGMLAAAVRGTPGPLRRAALLMAASLAVTAVAPSLPVGYAGLAGVGFAWSLLLTSVVGTLQTAEPAMLGRVMSLFAVVLLGGNAAGGPVAALTAVLAGPRGPFALGAVAALSGAFTAPTGFSRAPGSRARACPTGRAGHACVERRRRGSASRLPGRRASHLRLELLNRPLQDERETQRRPAVQRDINLDSLGGLLTADAQPISDEPVGTDWHGIVEGDRDPKRPRVLGNGRCSEFPTPAPIEREPVAPGDQRVEKGVHDEGRRVGRVTGQKVSGQRADRDAIVDGELAGPITGHAVGQKPYVKKLAVGVDAKPAVANGGEAGTAGHASEGEQRQAGAPHSPGQHDMRT